MIKIDYIEIESEEVREGNWTKPADKPGKSEYTYYTYDDYKYVYDEDVTASYYYFDYYLEVKEEQLREKEVRTPGATIDSEWNSTEPEEPKEPTAEELAEQRKLEKERADRKKEQMRLKAKGLERNPKIGFTYPGIDIEKLNDLQLKAKKTVSKEEEIMGEPQPEARIKIEPISADGSVTVSFNKDMVAPDTLDPSLYRKIFAMDVTSGLDGTSVKGDFGNPKNRRALQEKGLDEGDAAAALTFRLEVTEHTARGIKIKTIFDQPEAVSALAEDQFNF